MDRPWAYRLGGVLGRFVRFLPRTRLRESAGRSAKEYFSHLGKIGWVFFISGFGGILGQLNDIRRDDVMLPYWVWWLIAISCFVIASFIAFHRVRLERDALAEKKHDELNILMGIEKDLHNLRSRINNRDRDQVWTFVGQHIITAIQQTDLLPITKYADFHARINAATSGEIGWQKGKYISKHVVVVFISQFGQRDERGIISAFKDDDLRWGIDYLFRLLRDRKSWIQKAAPTYILNSGN